MYAKKKNAGHRPGNLIPAACASPSQSGLVCLGCQPLTPHWSHLQVDGKLIGAAIGAVTLIFAMATNSTTDNFRLDINGAKIEVGIWMLAQTSDPKDDPAKPRYCDQTESNSKCRTGNKDDDCCIALRDKCNTLKTFAVFCESLHLNIVVPVALTLNLWTCSCLRRGRINRWVCHAAYRNGGSRF